MKKTNILVVGGFSKYGNSNTCLHRLTAIQKYHNANIVDALDTTATKSSLTYKICNKLFTLGLPVRLPDMSGVNSRLIKLVAQKKYDVVWIDKGLTINSDTLKSVRASLPNCIIIGFSPDNMAMRFNQSQNFLECAKYYNYTVTTKSYIKDELTQLGFRNVVFAHKTFDDSFHYPVDLTEADIAKFGSEVGFIGAWEEERFKSIKYLVDNKVPVAVYGDKKWQEYKSYSRYLSIYDGLFSSEYTVALCSFKISLCFLRKKNLDQQTARTMEIPACGTFMLAERTQEHMNLFKEGEEAEFFSTDEELLSKCQYYLVNAEEREAIATRGLARCKTSGYSNNDLITKLLDKFLAERDINIRGNS